MLSVETSNGRWHVSWAQAMHSWKWNFEPGSCETNKGGQYHGRVINRLQKPWTIQNTYFHDSMRSLNHTFSHPFWWPHHLDQLLPTPSSTFQHILAMFMESNPCTVPVVHINIKLLLMYLIFYPVISFSISPYDESCTYYMPFISFISPGSLVQVWPIAVYPK